MAGRPRRRFGVPAALVICTVLYLGLAGEQGLSLRPQDVRAADVVRASAEDCETLGWSPQRLDEAFAYASTLSTDTLMIVTKGRTVGALGDPRAPYRTHSIRKALLSALVGQHIGSAPAQIRLDATLRELAIDDTPGPLTDLQLQATVRHLLQSMSGVNHPAAAEAGLISEKNSRLGQGENEPGTIWAYNNWDYNVLTTIFETRTGMSVAEAFQAGIAAPTAMKDFDLDAVTYVSEPELSRHKAASFRMSGRDLARFGQLYLNKGRMDDRQILPTSWTSRITTDFARTGRDDLRWGHGALWWIPSPKTGLPNGTFWAWGLGNQAVFVVPAWDTVVVHQSDTTEFLRRFIPMITSGGRDAETAIEALILSCLEQAGRKSAFCEDHRLTTRREFETLMSLIVKARL